MREESFETAAGPKPNVFWSKNARPSILMPQNPPTAPIDSAPERPATPPGQPNHEARGWFAFLGLVLLATTFNNLQAAAEYGSPTLQGALNESLGGFGAIYVVVLCAGALLSALSCVVAVTLMALRSRVARDAAFTALLVSLLFLLTVIALSAAGAEAAGRNIALADAFAVQALISGAKIVIVSILMAYVIRSATLRAAYGPFQLNKECPSPMNMRGPSKGA